MMQANKEGGSRARRTMTRLWHSPTLNTWLSLAIRLGGLAILLPLVLTHLSAPEVLVWQMLSTITMIVLWVDFGFSPTFSRVIAFGRGGGTHADLAKAIGRENAPAKVDSSPLDLAAIFATQHRIYLAISLAAIAIAAVFGTATLLRPVANLPSPQSGWIAWCLTMLTSQLMLLNGANASVLTGFNKVAWLRRMEALFGACQIASTSVAVVLGGGLIAITATYAFWIVPIFLVNRHAVQLLYREAGGTAGKRFDPVVFRLIWPAAWRSGVGILMSVGIIQSSGLIYAQFAAPAAAASYLLLLRLMTALGPIAQAPFYSKLPLYAEMKGARRHAELLRAVMRGMTLAHWTFVVGALSILYIAFPLLHYLGSSVPTPSFPMMATLFLAFFVERYAAMHIQVYSLTHHIVWHIANGVTGTLMIVLFFAFLPLLGPVAMPAAMLASYAGFCAWYTSRLSLKSLETGRWTFERPTSLAPGIVLVIGLALYPFLPVLA